MKILVKLWVGGSSSCERGLEYMEDERLEYLGEMLEYLGEM